MFLICNMVSTYIMYLILSNIFFCGHCIGHDKSKKNERNLKNEKRHSPEIPVQVRRIYIFLTDFKKRSKKIN